MPEATPVEPVVVAPSRTRVIGATVAGGLVTVILGVVANVAIGKATAKTQQLINPDPKPTTEN